MSMIRLICIVFALVCFIMAGFNIQHPRVNFVAIGLAFWVATELMR